MQQLVSDFLELLNNKKYAPNSIQGHRLDLHKFLKWLEIDENCRFLGTFPGVNRTRVFSIPFGGDRDYNDATIRLAAEAGHSAMLLSRGAVQRRDGIHDGPLRMVERVMPRYAGPSAFLEDLQARLSRG